jgi:L-alanine-DL-glutamate epimerase-like enolase superfamily enzyme
VAGTIARIETIPIRVPLDKTYSGSYYRMSHRSTIVTRVVTTEGATGVAYAADEDAALHEIDAVIHREIAPQVVGLDPLATERVWEAAYPVTFDQLRDRRVGLVACASVDNAVWDLVGKIVGVPLWRLWGGYRDRIPILQIGGYYESGDPAEEAAAVRAAGFAGMKFKVGRLSPEEDAARIHAARRGAGDGFALMADANQGWHPADATRFARLVADAGVYWFEEPCRWHNDRAAMRDVRHAAGIAVCAGQSAFSAAECRDLMQAGAIDFCNFDASWSGGATEWRRVAAIARAADVRMAHHEEPQISSHLLASIPHGTFVEVFSPERDPIWWNLIANRPEITDGHIALPTGPGLGWELDWDFVEAHRA